MQIMINLPDKMYNDYYKHKDEVMRIGSEIDKCVANGIPLPVGHGRLIDADVCYNELKKEIPNVDIDCSLKPYEEGIYSAMMEIKDTPTILEAESED